jgi:dTDP-4-dehydrorhamnose reductase
MECTVNRVGDRYFDQSIATGHHDRIDDLDRLAGLGIRTLRYPVLWERTMPDDRVADWSWPDARLARLRSLDVRPIVGLCHHGSGPPGTSLIDPGFPERLATYAGKVAERYPWVTAYTPVNEPLTTARFSGLYGHWYPHGRDDRTFVTALLVQCRAIGLAMRAIRAVQPTALLVQTEDLGYTRSTPRLAYQAAFENERRWLSLDLLAGRVDRHHPLWSYLRKAAGDDRMLGVLRDSPCPPDVLGINYYVTSERYLDDDLARHPPVSHGGNGRHRYADVETVRGCPEGLGGIARLLAAAWARYHRPLAVTEAHMGCTREEQLRWLCEIWDGVAEARRAGADVRAITAWAAFGSCDWNSLVTRAAGYYEPGLFDVRAPTPRPTAVAAAVRAMVAGERPRHPVLDGVGWWRRTTTTATSEVA